MGVKLVSFVVIAYNEERALGATLAGILGQRLPVGKVLDIEVIVVNDGSSDGTLDLAREWAARSPQVRVVDQPNTGRGAARAAGIVAARGDAVAFVDADIVLPADWLARTLARLRGTDAAGGADAVGGVPVPDGDVSLVHRLFGLHPKVRPAAAAVTGSNGLFRRQVFDVVAYDPSRRNGEDVALMAAMRTAGMSVMTLADLVVVHSEHKSYPASVGWLFESGMGATRQLAAEPTVRLPDVVAAGFWLVSLACALVALLTRRPFVALAPAGYVGLASAALLHQRFSLRRMPLRSGAAVVVQGTLLVAYFAGRLVGVRGAFLRRYPSADTMAFAPGSPQIDPAFLGKSIAESQNCDAVQAKAGRTSSGM